jgi:hypothetical protein
MRTHVRPGRMQMQVKHCERRRRSLGGWVDTKNFFAPFVERRRQPRDQIGGWRRAGRCEDIIHVVTEDDRQSKLSLRYTKSSRSPLPGAPTVRW